ncbi:MULTISPECIES: undecaprenyl-diphosphate phosphatase [Paenibacillus]|jgi:undecaprenyl-diphosphatase|uniref:Undecaprenyl-diphosphatase n=2 Tax=Paenibacillus lactis TaxID=228574 RepID=G4HMT7_9BACL|nr:MULTISPECIES: undecaprenyl-diphosphate phosphatase [Paenibacillus]EHB54302.1 undecaprenol kinase [Paenibacillus lactis 154]MBP1891561.1 undecaprenyl-diphosphatase [Paenibacillus lactis]MCM3494025.1 undecaprenyl-diphosphate phosphatase [Paenibacillus lactis]GIO88801.1 undecaprenyl-diphosphatase [Paenibacillus lactis]HAG00434.1 undecaprenyl-diphosphate phosphatase [Paenibacillus lactis]
MDFITILKAIILGIVEGLTEFAPVSSTGHMIIVDDMWLKSEEFLTKYVANTFKVVIQLGSILAVVVVFKDRFLDLLGLKRKKPEAGAPAGTGRLKLSQVIVGLIPAGVLGVLFEDFIDEHLFSTETVLIGLVLGAIFMILADKMSSNKEAKVVTVDQITYKQAFSVGLIQCLSLWPGFSRSGSTISGGVMLGMSHRAAADFTFIMAVPIMFGASLLSLLKNWEYFTMDALPFFIAGFLAAFVFALISIRFFLKLINRIKLVPFAIYRIVLAAVIALVLYL